MRRHLFPTMLLLFTLMGGSLSAQIPNGYYNDANGLIGDELKAALHDIIKDHNVVSYGGILNAFAYTDCKPNGKIWDMYSDYEYSLNTDLCDEFEQEGECWNREHAWPQSWFNESNTPRNDLFHVYPTDGFVNQQRGNYPYGEVNNPTYTSGNGSKLGPCATSGYSGKVFEPVDEYKGDLARSYFYMSVRYAGEDDDWTTSGMTNKAEIKPWALAMLLRWNDDDPVSQKEIDRNNAVYGYQNNRNPFIDHPEYARMIWDPNWQGSSYNIACATDLQHGSISAPESAPHGSTVTLTATPDEGYSLYSWYVFKTGDMSCSVSVNGNSFVMPAFDVTVMATFVQGGAWVKMTTAPADWSGEYILVYEQSTNTVYAWNGEDEANGYVSKTMIDNAIADGGCATLTVAAMTGGYAVKVNGGSHDGKYISGTAGNNKLNFGDAPVVNTLSMESNSVIMTSNTSVMRFNNDTGQKRFRYFKSNTYGSQQPVQFYTRRTLTHQIHFNPNGGSGTMGEQTVIEFEPTALQANTYTREGYLFDGWNTEADGTGDTYADEATVILFDDLTLYAQWSQPFDIMREYQKITSADQLVPGRTYLIVNVDHGKALGTTQNNNNRSAADVVVEDDLISGIDSVVCELTLGGSAGVWTFFDAGWGNNGGYLYAGSSSSNHLKTQASNNANGQWSITFGANGVATIQAQGNNSRNLLRYNNSSNIFSCYASGQLEVCLFRRTEAYDYPAEQTIALAPGWNWFSTYIDISLEQLQAVLVSALPGTAINIKSQTQNVKYQNGRWAGSLTVLDLTQMYTISVTNDCEITLEGTPLDPSELTITFNNGANWMAFPFNENMTVTDFFGSFPINNDQVKSQSQNAKYQGGRWGGQLNTLVPGQGYIYKSSTTQARTFFFPAR